MDAKVRCAAWSTVALIAASAASASGPAPGFPAGVQPTYREIGDWILACDNTRRCVAKYVLDDVRERPERFDEEARLTITRAAGSAAYPRIEIMSASASGPARLQIDGVTWPLGPAWHRRGRDHDATLDGADALALTRRLRNARTLTWSTTAGSATVSLRGLAAVLIAMDDAQDRIGDSSSLLAFGVRRTASVAAPVPPPILRPGAMAPALRDPTGLIRTVRRSQAAAFKIHACDQAAGINDSAAALDGRIAIVLLGCGRFAYQTSVLAFLVPPRTPEKAQPLILADPMWTGPSDAESIGEYVGGSYDPATRVFAMFAKGRGMADCGTSAEWTYDGQTFRLSSYAAQQRCGGDPGDWPTLFRTRLGSDR